VEIMGNAIAGEVIAKATTPLPARPMLPANPLWVIS
jgi:hypothetical protein